MAPYASICHVVTMGKRVTHKSRQRQTPSTAALRLFVIVNQNKGLNIQEIDVNLKMHPYFLQLCS